MKAITLHQPWATLVAIGAKRVETRSWSTAYRGPLAIHAGKSTENLSWAITDTFSKALGAAGYRLISDLPLGCVVCTVRLVNCIQTDLIVNRFQGFTEQEFAFGNYDPGRFAWILDELHSFYPPIPARGKQGLWEWEQAE